MGKSGISKQTLFIASVVSLGGFLFGFDAAIISGVAGYVNALFGLTEAQLGWAVSSPTAAAAISMLTAGAISDKIGRKKVLIGVAILYAVSAFFSAYASSFHMLWIARFIGGLAFGAALVIAPIYIAEISTAENRGKLVSIQQLNIVIGFSAAYFAGYFLNKAATGSVDGMINEENVWRWMLGLELIPAILYLILLFAVPRSPRWLYVKQRDEDAYDVLKRLHGEQRADIEEELIQTNLKEEANKDKSRLLDIFKPSLKFVLVIGLLLGVLQQITGVNAIYFYATTIFEQSGVGTNAAFAQAIWVGIINVVFTLLAMALIDKMGRKPLMLIGLAGVAISMSLTAYGFKQATYELTSEKVAKLEGVDQSKLAGVIGKKYDNDVDFKNALKAALGNQEYSANQGQIIAQAGDMNPIIILIGILGFVASFAFSLGPVMWVMLSELFPTKVRGMMISFVGFINAVVSWVVQQVFPWELSNWGNATTMFIFGMFALAGFLILAKMLPETKGKSLEEIEKELVKA